MSPLLLGIDVGTSTTKVGVFTAKGRLVVLHTAPTPITWDGPESAHHHADELWRAVARLLKQTTAQLGQRRKALAAIGISSFGESGVLVGADGKPAMPEMLAWFDDRPRKVFEQALKKLDRNWLFGKTGLSADATYSLSKLLWLKQNHPSAFKNACWVSTADWIAYKLSGQLQMGVTQASRTLMFDLRHQAWLPEVLDEFGLHGAMPTLRLPGSRIGSVQQPVARLTGLPSGLPVMETGHDQTCAAAGVGATAPGIWVNSCGTAEVMFAAIGSEQVATALKRGANVGHHALPSTYYLKPVLRASGSVWDWLTRAVGATKPGRVKQLIHSAAQISSSDGLLFIPHMRQLSDDPKAILLQGGVFLGLRETHQAGHLARVVLEGLAVEGHRLFERVQHATGSSRLPQTIRAVGGPTRNALWMQLKADLFGVPVEVYSSPHAAAWGAAWLGWHHLSGEKLSEYKPTKRYEPGDSEAIHRVRERYWRAVGGLVKVEKKWA
jgi:xylulokinase